MLGSDRSSWTQRAAAAAVTLMLTACGGGGSPQASLPEVSACDVSSQKDWLRSYMRDWYFWYANSPNPEPAGYATVSSYYSALMFTGNAAFPADRWSYSGSTESFSRFYGDGQTLGYGVAVAGVEVRGQPSQPLYIRYVAPNSPAALAGLARSDRVLAINGVPASQVITADDYSGLSALTAGERVTLDISNAGGSRSVQLNSVIYAVTPVDSARVLNSPGGRKTGYVFVNNMMSQGAAPLESAFASFKQQGVQDVILDMRYNGGGLVSFGATVASYITGSRAHAQVYTQLVYNDRKSDRNQTFSFSTPTSALSLNRVYVLAGPRTCSASEQVISGLRGSNPRVDVVLIGDTTCGKPMGFLPANNQCGTTYSAVNFEGLNARGEGRYWDGLRATCSVRDDVQKPLGVANEGLVAAALSHADTGACPAGSAGREMPMTRAWVPGARPEPGVRHDMIAR